MMQVINWSIEVLSKVEESRRLDRVIEYRKMEIYKKIDMYVR